MLSIPTVLAQSYNPNGVTVAGGNDRGSAANQLFNPLGIYVDPAGNLYVTDTYNQRIQKWAPGASSGTTVAGSNGIGDAANQFNFPQGVWVDAAGNLYVADFGNYRIQKFAPGSSQGVTVAGGNGQGTAANQFYFADDVAVDAAGNVYVADAQNHRVQKWVPGASSGTTVASGPEALGIYLDAAGNIYVADGGNSRILKFGPGSNQGVIVAGGNGRGSAANQLANPVNVWVDPAGNIYVADQLNHRIQKWAPGATSGTTVAGGNGTGNAANQLTQPVDVAVDAAGNVYVADPYNNRIQRFSLLPTLSGLSASPNPVCVGSAVTFNATVGNVSGVYNYTLTNGAGSAKQGTATGTVFSQSLTATGSGTQSFTLTVASGGSVVTATTSLTVTTQTPDYQPLADLYNATGGANWTNKTGWLTGCSPCGWYGVTCTNGRVTGLNLINNNLVGTLPTSLSALTNLQSLELGANALTGGIPSGIASLTALQTLNLSRTQLGGTIPTSLGQLTQLQNLLLNESALTGTLPASLGNLTQLQNLQLYTNQLSGCFPGNYTALCGRAQINFTGNPNLPGGGDFGAFCSNGTGSELVISQAPSSATACVGSPFSFSFVARGAASYQWYKDGQRLAESGPVLSFSSVSGADAGTYQVYINYACRPGAVQSDYFTLTVRSDGACPASDLVPLLYVSPGLVYGPSSVSVIVSVVNVGTLATSGPINLRISRDPMLQLSLPASATTVGARKVQNELWSLDSSDPDVYVLRTSQVLGSGSQLSVGLVGSLVVGNTRGQLSVSAVLEGDSGGEVRITNNTDAEKIDYFNK
ncbi:hypothetical protein GCM10028774_27240 [Spirosoma jeollabukense]